MKKSLFVLALVGAAIAQDAPKSQVGLIGSYDMYQDSDLKDAEIDKGPAIGLQGKYFFNPENAVMAVADYSFLSKSETAGNMSIRVGFYGLGHSFRKALAPKTSLITEELIGWNTAHIKIEATGFGSSEDDADGALGYRAVVGVEQQVGVVALQARLGYTGGEVEEDGDVSRITVGVGAVLGFK